jgi:hypothetical protein
MSLQIPHFENEEQEAQWWYDHREETEREFLQALKEGRARPLSDTERGRRVIRAAKRALAAREAAKTLIASVQTGIVFTNSPPKPAWMMKPTSSKCC